MNPKSFLITSLLLVSVVVIALVSQSMYQASVENPTTDFADKGDGLENAAAIRPSSALTSTNHLIAVRKNSDGSYDFYNKKTGSVFNPRGFSYIRLNTQANNPHATFNPGYYNPAAADTALQNMHNLGYNLVRVIINSDELITSGAQVSEQYVTNVADFISKAATYDMQVMIVLTLYLDQSQYPPNTNTAHFTGANWLIMTNEALNYRKQFLKNFVASLNEKAPTEHIFSYDLGEFTLDSNLPPLNLPIGTAIRTTLGTFRIGKNSDLISKHYSNFLTQMSNAIKEVDKNVLVGVDAFHGSHPFIGSKVHDTSVLFKSTSQGGPNIDYVGLQMYLPIADAQKLNFKQFLDQFGIVKNSVRPVILEEYGDTKTQTWNIDVAVNRLKDWTYYAMDDYNLKGSILWTYDTNENSSEGNNYWLGIDGNSKVAKALSPNNLHLKNLALNKAASFASQQTTSPASHALDGNLDTSWSSGRFSPQQITVDLKSEYNINAIRLLVSQYPQGSTIHKIYAGTNPNNLTLIKTFNQVTKDNDWLVHYMSNYMKVRYVKVETTKSPSWVGWREIKIYGTDGNEVFGGDQQPSVNLALNKKVTASKVFGSMYATNLVDDKLNTVWNSGGFAPQWFTVDLGKAVTFNNIELYANQSPAGLSTHQIYAGSNLYSLKLIKTISQNIGTNDVLNISLENIDARYIKVNTTRSPSWVSWKEIKVYKK